MVTNMSRKLATVVLAAIAVAVCSVVVARSHFNVDGRSQFTLVDDAMISLRYARNLAHGDGLVWNVGEPPVEGFTNLGYTLLMTPGFAFGDGVFSRYFPVFLTVLGFVATVLLTFAIARMIWPESPVVPLAAGAMVALDFGLIFWSARGMEVSLVTATVLGMTFLYMRWRHSRVTRDLWCGAACGAAAIVFRLDAIVFVLTVTVWLITCEWLAGRRLGDDRRVGNFAPEHRAMMLVLGVPFAGVLALLVFQAAYFGDALPNTYRLKMQGVSVSERLSVGVEVLKSNAAPQLRVLALLGPVLIAAFSWKKLRNGDIVLLAVIAGVSVAYSIWVGGDYAEPQVHAPNRFILVGIPALCVLAAGGLESAVTRLIPAARNVWVSATVGVVAVAIVVSPNWNDEKLRSLFSGEIPMLDTDQERAKLGLRLRRVLPKDTTIAVHAAGQIPYYSDLRTIDLLGKNDRTVASLPQSAGRFRPGHSKWNYDYSITELSPDVVIDEWGESRKYLESHPGYQRLPNGIWLSAKPHVAIDAKALGALCYWTCKDEG